MKSFFRRFSPLVHSIRFRLAAWFVLILSIVVVLFCGLIYVRQSRDLQNTAIRRLEMRAQMLGRFLHLPGQELLQPPSLTFPSDPISGESFVQSEDLLAFITTDGEILQSWGSFDTGTVQPLVNAAFKNQEIGRSFLSMLGSAKITGDNSRRNYVLIFSPVVFGNELAGYYLMGSPIDPGNLLPRLGLSLILGILVTLVVAMLGGFWLADRAMQPVKAITQAARTISETDLNRRLHLNQKDELGELARTFDDMLARLQAAFERQRQFTADASHELRTPLTIINLEASRALESLRTIPEYQRTLEVVSSENQLMIHMVNNLLTLARMDAGQVVLQKEDLDLSDIALEVVERLAPLAVENQVRLATGDLPELLIRGDRQYLVQMLTNLVENAIKYACCDEKHILVTAGSSYREEGKLAWVRVSDNGPGISPEHLPHLFDRFYRVDIARSRADEDEVQISNQLSSSTGLGLSICQWIARSHGGKIEVQSELGKGSTFEVYLPWVDTLPTKTST